MRGGAASGAVERERSTRPTPAGSERSILRVRAVVALARPQFWLLSVAGLYLGFVLATRRLLPLAAELTVLLHAAAVAGPLLWLSVLAVNDAHDQETDRRNPRKAAAVLVTGSLTRRQVLGIGAVAGGVAVLAAIPLGPLFTVGVALTLLLGWAYSTPPLRLKARPGFDVLSNAFAVACLGPLGGWVALHGTASGYPWPMSLVGGLAVAALYLPTTLVDHDADLAAGARTTAVAIGPRATFELGFALWTASALLATGLAADVIIDRSLLPLQVIMIPLLLIVYRVLLRGRPPFRAITVVAACFLIPCGAFALTYVGLLG